MSRKTKAKIETGTENDDDYEHDAAGEMLDTAVRNTPWWALSLGFHGVVLASLPLIVFSHRLLAADDRPVIIDIRRPKVTINDLQPTDIRRDRALPGDDSKERDDDKEIALPPNVLAEESDHFEKPTPDPRDDEHGMPGTPDGRSWDDALTGNTTGRMPGLTSGNNISTGVGGGSGAPGKGYGNGMTGRAWKYKKIRHGRTGDAVEEGLRWLARHQAPDGHWSSDGYNAQCQGGECHGAGYSEFDVGNTGLALLGFLGAGYSPQNSVTYTDPVTKKKTSFGETVRRGLRWLIDHEDKEGCIGPHVGEMMYNQAIGALALSEAYGLTNAVAYRAPAQRAINFIHVAQNYGLGWRYTPRCGDNDTSVTGWCVMALKSAQISGLEVSRTSFDGAKAWITRMTDERGATGYMTLGSDDIYAPGKNEEWRPHPTMTAVGLLCRIFIDKKKGDKVNADAAKLLMTDLPRWEVGPKPNVDFYYWYYATLALFQEDGPSGPSWTRWNNAISDLLCKTQKTSKDGCQDGSWDVEHIERWAYAGGRVYGTAINVLTLETSFRYELVFGSGHDGK